MAHAEHCKQLLDKLQTQREAGFLCDCTIVIGDGHYRAHRNVLASFSEYFRALFKDTLDCTILLDQKQVTPAGFQTMLDFIYSGDLHLDRCPLEEILNAAEYLRLEEVVLTCRTKLNCVMMEEACSTELPSAEDCPDTDRQPEHTAAGDKRKDLRPPKKITNRKTARSKKWKRKITSTQKMPKKVAGQQNGTSDACLPVNRLQEALVEQTTTDHCLPPGTMTLSCESFLPEANVTQLSSVRQKQVRSPQNGALKEHCMANITSASNMCRMEDLVKDADEKYYKNKPTCNTCGKVFSEASSLRRHMRIHKGVKPYVCHLCGKAFTQCNQLKTHVRTHTGEKPYQCKLCDKGFAQKCQLVFHSRMHHGEEKPYKCDVCNLQFATSSNLKIHVRKHSGEKPYVCDRCGQRFAQASTLTYHVRRHTGEKPYVCDTCGKAFAVSSSLITHARKHTGEKPYICGVCGKSFISSGELNKHFRSHTGERPFVCEVCGNSYTDVKNLKKHNLKMHSGNEETEEAEPSGGSLNEEDTAKTSSAPDCLDLKPSELFLPLTLHIGPEDHQMLLPVTDNQCLSSDALLRTSVSSYSEPQFIFLQQMY
ncbi:myoneurin [Hyla sarda]|uniref:myoneurin n=1 Tax=Hyla sarda TaxID=327740 RepID=UPI0024C45F24|nr:myoneurin [Hyla sarda]XP_056421092.1 myoneurin [Hyla sarda]XP_056421093.1 myoneurin [Hyla sarda]